MNSRERVLTMGLVLIVLVVGGGWFLLSQFYFGPMQNRKVVIENLEKEVQQKQDKLDQIKANRAKLDQWRMVSLPPDEDLVRREYEKYLSELLRETGFGTGAFTVTSRPPDSKTSPSLPGKKPIYTTLAFTVQAHAGLDNLVDMMEGFYRTPLMHQIKKVSLLKPVTRRPDQQPDELDINMTVEALIVQGIDARTHLIPLHRRQLLSELAMLGLQQGGPSSLLAQAFVSSHDGPFGPGKLAHANRDYTDIVAKDIFHGPLPPEEKDDSGPDEEGLKYVYLTDITTNSRRAEAFLYDRLNNKPTRLRSSMGFNSFKIDDVKGETIVQGTILSIAEREILLQVSERFYTVHVGQNLEQAMRKPTTTKNQLDGIFRTIGGMGGI